MCCVLKHFFLTRYFIIFINLVPRNIDSGQVWFFQHIQRVLIFDCWPISFEWNNLWVCIQWPEVRELQTFISDMARVCILGADQTSLWRWYSSIYIILIYFFFSNLEVFESHLGSLPFDIHHALKVNTFMYYAAKSPKVWLRYSSMQI